MSSSSAEPAPVAGRAAPPVPARGAGRRRPKVARWVLGTLLAALLLRSFVVRTYAIRSDSMEPLFHGGTEDGTAPGDRLLVLDGRVDARRPERWDAAVFDASVDPTLPPDLGALLKRIVALPGDRLQFRGGDLWLAPAGGEGAGGPAGPDGGAGRADAEPPLAIARKPDALVEALLVPFARSAGLEAPWRWSGPGAPQPTGSGGVLLGAEGPGEAVFEQLVDDRPPPGPGEAATGAPGEHLVPDTGLAFTVAGGQGVLELVLREGADVFRARLAPAGEGGAALFHNLAGRVVAAAPEFPGLRAGMSVLAWNVDDGVRVRIDGRPLLSFDYAGNAPVPDGAPARNEPELRLVSGRLELRGIVVLRDAWLEASGRYGAPEAPPFPVPPGQAFLLGDNAARSRDSRSFGPVPLFARRGRPIAVWRPLARAGWMDPLGLRR